MQPEPVESGNKHIFTLLERVLFLKEVDLFRNVDTERLSVIAEIAREITAEENEVIARENEPSEALYIIKSGALKIVKEKDGVQYNLKNIGEGQCFGVFGLFGSGKRSAGAVANERTVLYEIRKSEFKKVLMSNPEIAYNILEILGGRLNEMDDEVVLLNKTLALSLKGDTAKTGERAIKGN
ncbi:MAG: Crp/Fnr family transcriptional regulator [Syntrophaceae bacterium]